MRASHRATGHFPAPGDVEPELVLHRIGEVAVLDQDVELPVAHQARGVEVARADPAPSPVRHDRLGVQHRSFPLVDSHPAPQQIAVSDSREVPHQRQVARSRHQQPHVHAVPRRVLQGQEESGRRHEIGIGDPEPAACCPRSSARSPGRCARGRALHRSLGPRLHPAASTRPAHFFGRAARSPAMAQVSANAWSSSAAGRSGDLHRGISPGSAVLFAGPQSTRSRCRARPSRRARHRRRPASGDSGRSWRPGREAGTDERRGRRPRRRGARANIGAWCSTTRTRRTSPGR